VTKPAARSTIAVVIPCFDMGRYLEQTVRCVLSQTRRPDEIIVVDDGSRDPATKLMLDRLPADVRLVRQANRGPGEARNAGIRAATAEMVLPLDADDLLAPRALERYERALLADPGASFAHSHVRFFGAVRGRLDVPPFNPYLELDHNRLVVTALIRRSVFTGLGAWYPATRIYEDWSFWLSCARAGLRGVVVEDDLFLYRRKRNEGLLFEADRDREMFRAAVRAMHPDLYSREGRASLKARYAPGLEILWRGEPGDAQLAEFLAGQTLRDVAVAVGAPAGAGEYARVARGKYALELGPEELRIARSRGPSLLERAVRLLESRRRLRAVSCGRGIVVWRVVSLRLLPSWRKAATSTTGEFARRWLRRGVADVEHEKSGQTPVPTAGDRSSPLRAASRLVRRGMASLLGDHRMDRLLRTVRSAIGETVLGWPPLPGDAGIPIGIALLPRSRRVELSLLDDEPVRLERAAAPSRTSSDDTGNIVAPKR
jgi:hypothetical protein